MQYNLNEIWEILDMNNDHSSQEEKEMMSKLVDIENKLSKKLNTEQKVILSNLMNTISDLSYIERREAFIRGIRFATQYLLDAADLI